MLHTNKLLQKIFALTIAVLLLMSLTSLTVFADAGADQGADPGEVILDDGNVDSGSIDSGDDAIDSGESPDIEQGEVDNGMGENEVGEGEISYEEPTYYVPEDVQDSYEQIRDSYINGLEEFEDNLNGYVPNENLAELETVAPTDIIMATAEPLPDVAVSDASLFSGIVMWLCVAVGISVVAGVMVSKRTHRRGA